MSRHTDIDIEQLLRRTYAEVAARTTVEASASVGAGPATSGAEPRRPWVLAAAAGLIVVLVVGIALVARRGPDSPAASGDRLVHAVPLFVPAGIPLQKIESTPTSDRLVYRTDTASIEITVNREPIEAPAGQEIRIRRDLYATLLTGAGGDRLTWRESNLLWIDIATTGMDVGALRDVAEWMLPVDQHRWEGLTANGGFGAIEHQDEPSISYALATGGRIDVSGSLQAEDGLQLEARTSFGSVGIGVGIQPCLVQPLEVDGGDGGLLWWVVGPAAAPAVVIEVSDNDDHTTEETVDVEAVVPGLPLTLAIVEFAQGLSVESTCSAVEAER